MVPAILIAAIAAVLFATAGASGAPKTFNLLFISSNEGATGAYSEATGKILQFEVAQWNKTGGILGMHVNLIVKDDGGSAANGATILKSELSSTTINWVYNLQDEFAEAPELKSAKVMNSVIGGIAALESTSTFPYTWGSVNVNAAYEKADMYLLMSHFHAHKIAFIYAADGVADAYFTAFQAELKSFPSLSLVGSQSVTPTQVDTTPQLTALQADNPDVLIVESLPPTYGIIMKDLSNLGWKVPVLLSPGGIADTTGPASIVSPSYLMESDGSSIPCVGYRDSKLPNGSIPAYLKPLEKNLHTIFGATLPFAIRFYMFTWDAALEIKVGVDGAHSLNPDKINAYLGSLKSHYPSPNPFVQHLDLTATSHFPHDYSGMDITKCAVPTDANGLFTFDTYVPWPASLHIKRYPG